MKIPQPRQKEKPSTPKTKAPYLTPFSLFSIVLKVDVVGIRKAGDRKPGDIPELIHAL
jgi:hypothetical protein